LPDAAYAAAEARGQASDFGTSIVRLLEELPSLLSEAQHKGAGYCVGSKTVTS
jgi:hypothetical protein